jgi:hypothetical protein
MKPSLYKLLLWIRLISSWVIEIIFPVSIILALFQSQIALVVGCCVEAVVITTIVARRYPIIQIAVDRRKEVENIPGPGGLFFALVLQLFMSLVLWPQPVDFNWSYSDSVTRWIYYSLQGFMIVLFEIIIFMTAYMSLGVILRRKQQEKGAK